MSASDDRPGIEGVEGADGFPRTTKALRDVLAAHGMSPAKRHGQCFLTDVQAIDAIVRDAEISPGDAVIEVGTGTGLLTHALAEAGASVDTFDIDPKVQDLARSLRAWPERVRFHGGDALDGKHALAPSILEALSRARREAGPGRVKFVSNLPYNAATPVLLALLVLPDPPDTITAMVQLEVGRKMLAPPGGDDYGPPSILRALQAEGRILRRFPPQVFWPQPKVLSALLRLVPRRPGSIRPEEERDFATFLLALFSRRRKVVVTALLAARPALERDGALLAVAAAGIDAKWRPEDVAPEALLDLCRRTSPARGET